MARLRYNNSLGQLGAALSSGSNTITFAAAPSWNTLTGSDYIPITLDPPSTVSPNSAFEIVYVTAYTSGATTATISRGMEGTTATSHLNGAVWVCAAEALDITSMATPVAARAYRTGALTLNGLTKVPVDTLTFDTASNMDVTTNNRYNCPVSGYYLVIGQIDSGTGISPPVQARLYKNGSEVSVGADNDSTTYGANVQDVLFCAAGDYIELYAYTGSSVAANVGDPGHRNYLSVTLLSPNAVSNGIPNVARAYRNTALTPGSSSSKISLDTLSFDPTGGMVDVSTNHRINITQAGWYHVSGEIQGSSSYSGLLTAYIYKNNSLVSTGSASSGNSAAASVDDVIQCSVGDYLELWVNTPGSQALAVGASTVYLAVAQVAPPTGTGNANALPAGAAYQAGIINSGDLAQSAISINSSTGAVTITLAAAQQLIVKDTNGLLVPITVSAQTYTFTPPTLPTTGNTVVQGVEIDVNGILHAVSGSSVAGTLSTASTIETNTPTVTSGRLRIWDVGVYNASGTYEFSNASATAAQGVNWVDRRPTARGAFSRIVRNSNASAGIDYLMGASAAYIDAANLTMRIECSGAPLTLKLNARIQGGGAGSGGIGGTAYGAVWPTMDGAFPDGMTSADGVLEQDGLDIGRLLQWTFLPSAGSHAFSWQAAHCNILARAVYPLEMLAEEDLRGNWNNGTA